MTNRAGDVDEPEPICEFPPAGASTSAPNTEGSKQIDVAPIAETQAAPSGRGMPRWLVVAAVVVAAAAAGGVAVVARQPRRHAPLKSFADATVPFPSETASDVVSYSDHVALVTAVSEVEVSRTASPAAVPSGERTIGRRVTFRVDATLWSRADAPAAPAEFNALWSGWLLTDDQRMPFAVQGMPWVFVGGQYVMPIAYDGEVFSPIQRFAVFRFVDSAVALEIQDTELARQLARASRGQISTVFANAVPDPLAVRYRDLFPRARLAAVIAARTR